MLTDQRVTKKAHPANARFPPAKGTSQAAKRAGGSAQGTAADVGVAEPPQTGNVLQPCAGGDHVISRRIWQSARERSAGHCSKQPDAHSVDDLPVDRTSGRPFQSDRATSSHSAKSWSSQQASSSGLLRRLPSQISATELTRSPQASPSHGDCHTPISGCRLESRVHRRRPRRRRALPGEAS
jgi:hypothetical protein